MLQATAARVADPSQFAQPIVVGNIDHASAIVAQLGELGITPQVILEPCARNTAPALALAALEIARHDPSAIMLALPSDHLVNDINEFARAVASATAAASDGWLVTLGIKAESAETGYGYIESGDRLFPGVDKVLRFVEKPDRATAEAYVASGRFAWNGGYIIARVDALLAALAAYEPDILAACTAALNHARREPGLVHPDAECFARSVSKSIDHAVLERADNVAVVPVSMGWSDIGSWDALHAVGPHDAAGNTITGRVIAIDTRRCLVFSDGPIVATIGVHDINIVVTSDAVLVTAAGRAQDVKQAVACLGGETALIEPCSVREVWGHRRRLAGGAGLLVEEITMVQHGCWPDADGELTVLSGSIVVDGETVRPGARIAVKNTSVTTAETATILRVAGELANVKSDVRKYAGAAVRS